jgi:DNA-binding NarL/FixJ family response regulator
MDEPIKILLADDHKIFREGFKLTFRKSGKINLVGVAADGKEVIEIASKIKLDVILMDIQMPIMDGIEATRVLKKNYPHIGIIALSSFDENLKIRAMIDAGARGYLLKNALPSEVRFAIEEVYHGGNYFSESITEKLASMVAILNSYNIIIDGIEFSKKDICIMQLLCAEYSTKQIAAEMKIKPRTIEWYREGLIQKTKSKTVAGVISFAIKHQIDEFPI